ncbi:DUF1054 family protein [Loigolactobacillus bifermentans]|uniref:Uncharacterized protein n=1 Tax=Loigolactobacillus bifermentans DSM 20003 TaxID=1423726 RepID=A0A0R1H753_9LACO|nr:DUF1054 family protein [Loigolactobacillus bifermentans]KRK40435.1 hypothetical protein FC07_GL000443 [Loigolactobacillus bifermentans DSM 20003]QGG59841.1 DUF1054 family protein [Loigolactobacillus bifermentans]
MPFTQQDFSVFDDQTVTGRLAKIQQQLDPKFTTLGTQLVAQVATPTQPAYLQLARHARRYRNPAPNTWLAVGPKRQGYKMVPHFEIGFWDDRLFLWLCVLNSVTTKAVYVPYLAAHQKAILALKSVDRPWQLSNLHTTKQVQPLTATNLQQQQHDFTHTKKGEWLLGLVWYKQQKPFQGPGQVERQIQQAVAVLTPLYQDLIKL